MGLKDLFSNGLKGTVSGVLDGAAGIISKIKADPTKVIEIERDLEVLRANTEIKLTEIAADVEKAYLVDTQSARSENTKIQESVNASWLAKNVGYCIDIFLLAVFCGMLVMIVYKSIPLENKELFYTAFGALTMYVGQCISFHRGTTKSSGEKQKTIDRILSK